MRVKFFKLNNLGNDFILFEKDIPLNEKIVRNLCDRNLGIGADGVILLERSKKGFKMNIFNSDGSKAKSCGNALFCVFRFLKKKLFLKRKKEIFLDTMSGRIKGNYENKISTIYMPVPRIIKKLSLNVDEKKIDVIYVDASVPHAVLFTEDIRGIDVEKMGRKIRSNSIFAPEGSNVTFVEVKNKKSLDPRSVDPRSEIYNLSVRTYEKGVEKETFACGTGALAAVKAVGARKAIASFFHGDIGVSFSKKEVKLSSSPSFTFKGEVDFKEF